MNWKFKSQLDQYKLLDLLTDNWLFKANGFFQITAWPSETHRVRKRNQLGVRVQSHVRYAFIYLGWRIYMEDAHIAVSPLSDKKNSLFAVFDGHGGSSLLLAQVPKYPNLLKDISLNSWRQIKTTSRVITKSPWSKLSSEWINLFSVKPENNKS